MLILTACNDNSSCLEGQGALTNYPLELDSFRKISLSGDLELQIKQGNDQKVVITTQPSIFSVIEYGVRGETLEIGYENNVNCISSPYGIWVNIQVPDLDEIRISGETEVIVQEEEDIFFDQLNIIVSGVAKITLRGDVNQQRFDISGVVDVYNFGCIAQDMEIQVSGIADIEVNVQNSLDLTVSGSAKVMYIGNPQISQEVSGSLELIDRN